MIPKKILLFTFNLLLSLFGLSDSGSNSATNAGPRMFQSLFWISFHSPDGNQIRLKIPERSKVHNLFSEVI
jgi:hypothetical protein